LNTHAFCRDTLNIQQSANHPAWILAETSAGGWTGIVVPCLCELQGQCFVGLKSAMSALPQLLPVDYPNSVSLLNFVSIYACLFVLEESLREI